ncbi:NAD-dependent formate dehydrogenase beta subunit [hydrothermal vent metagenome]|uniref:NAD-dependent formate dehydrogenase beta subunit n=1 Tax=hydrothermal vent metagenome TaxID=652676 RepID=A0A3B0S8H9_9ZZZZ
MAQTISVYVPCDAAALSVGANDVAAAIAAQAKQQGETVQIIRNGSRGMMWLEPLVEVQTPKGRFAYGPVKTGDIASLFAAGFLHGNSHELSQGITEAIPWLAKQERLIFARCGLHDPLDLAAYEANGGLAGLRKALAMSPEQIVEIVTQSGLRGRGGAGFPTGIKWKTTSQINAKQKYICANADEGDSGTFADRMLLEGDPFCLLEGISIAARAIGADTGYIYVRSEYPHAIRSLKTALQIWQQAGHLDGAKDAQSLRIHIRTGAGAYICGEETSMLESIEGKRGQVKVKPPIPAISGLFGQPTIINNVLSLASVPIILDKGAAFYQNFGQGRSRGTQAFQLGGDIARGGLVEKAFGVCLRELVEDFGGGTRSGKPVRAVQTGGPLGAYIPVSGFDVQMDYEKLAEAGAMLGHGGIVVFNDEVDMAKQARFAMQFCEIESCGKCTPCRIGSVRGKNSLDKIIAGEDVEQNLALLDEICTVLRDGSLCAMGGLTPMPVQSARQHFPEDFTRAK